MSYPGMEALEASASLPGPGLKHGLTEETLLRGLFPSSLNASRGLYFSVHRKAALAVEGSRHGETEQ